jgi:hypothetical protein
LSDLLLPLASYKDKGSNQLQFDPSLLPPSSYEVLDPHEGAFKYIEHRRRELVAKLFWLKLSDPDLKPTLDELTSIYVPWRDYPLFGAYEKVFPDGSVKTLGVKCRKRGNDVDCWVKKRAFKRVSRKIRKLAVFNRSKAPTRNPTYSDNIFGSHLLMTVQIFILVRRGATYPDIIIIILLG